MQSGHFGSEIKIIKSMLKTIQEPHLNCSVQKTARKKHLTFEKWHVFENWHNWPQFKLLRLLSKEGVQHVSHECLNFKNDLSVSNFNGNKIDVEHHNCNVSSAFRFVVRLVWGCSTRCNSFPSRGRREFYACGILFAGKNCPSKSFLRFFFLFLWDLHRKLHASVKEK